MKRENRASLSEQLEPLASRMRKSISKVRPVSQVLITLPSADLESSFQKIHHEILKWAQKRAGRRLPDNAWEGDSFELEEVGAQPLEATHLKYQDYYALKLDDDDKETPQRSWTTEVSIARHKDFLLLGARLFCVTRGEDASFTASVPGFVRQIAEIHAATIDGYPIGNGPWLVNNEGEIEKLVSLLVNPDRKHDVCILSTENESEDPSSTLLDANRFFIRTAGAVHTVVLTSSASYGLTKKIGKEFSVFNQSVRTYRPGFDPDESELYDHPLAMGRKISIWDGGPSAFEDLLITRCLRQTVAEARMSLEESVPPYVRVKEIARKLRQKQQRDAAKSDEELVAVAEEEIDDLKKQMERDRKEHTELLSEAEEERELAIAERNEAKNRIINLEHRIQYLETAQPKSQISIPENFATLEEWAQKHLAGKVVVHSRAFQTAKKSEKECGPDNIRLAYETLLVLRDNYVPMRREGGQNYKEEYKRQLQERGLKESQAFAGAGAGKHGDIYFLKFAGKRRQLELHLKKGTGRDPRNCFRLYFFWDADTEQVVVGSFPMHLKTDIT